MEKFARTGMLLEIYGGLLTPRQKDVMNLYYDFDLSLAEIAQEYGISRQGVHDLIKRSGQILENAESSIGTLELKSKIESDIENLQRDLDELASLMDNKPSIPSKDFIGRIGIIKDKLSRLGIDSN